VFDALVGKQVVGKVAHITTATPQNGHLKTVVLVQMNVCCADDTVVVAMLKVGERTGKIRSIVIEYEGERADHLCIGFLPSALDETVSDQIANGLGSIRITLAFPKCVERLEQMRLEGDTESFNVGFFCGRHGRIPLRSQYNGFPA